MSQLPPPPDDAARGSGTPSDVDGGAHDPTAPPPPGGEGAASQWGDDRSWSQTPAGPSAGYRRPMSASQERTWGMAAHLSALIMLLGIPSLVGPLVVWLVKRDESAFVDDQGKESLNFNLSVLIYAVVGSIVLGIIGVLTLGLGFIVLALAWLVGGLAWLVVTIIAAVRASEGRAYRYPATIRFLK